VPVLDRPVLPPVMRVGATLETTPEVWLLVMSTGIFRMAFSLVRKRSGQRRVMSNFFSPSIIVENG